MPLYNLKSTGTPLYSITKFTDDLDVEATYSVARTACDCPAGARASCRHRQMLPTLLERVDTAWFYDFDLKSWSDPTGEANKPATVDTLEFGEGTEPATFEEIDEPIAPKAGSQTSDNAELERLDNTQALYEEVVKAKEAGIDLAAVRNYLPTKPAPAFKRRL